MSYNWYKLFDSVTDFENNIPKGKIVNRTIARKTICFVNGSDGIYALSNKCPHNGASLSMGYCNDKDEIICPLHRYPFNIKTGRATSGIACSADTYPIKIENTGVYIGIKRNWWEF